MSTGPQQRWRPAAVGFDPSGGHAAWAMWDISREQPIAAGVIDIWGKPHLPTLEEGMQRIERYAARHGYRIVSVAIERQLRASTSRVAAYVETLAWQMWGKVAAAGEELTPVRIIHPSDWKRIIGLRALAKKPEVMEWAIAHGWDLSVAGFGNEEEIGDAAGLCMAGVLFPYWWRADGERIYREREIKAQQKRRVEDEKRAERQRAAEPV